jgi:hypothetical protein
MDTSGFHHRFIKEVQSFEFSLFIGALCELHGCRVHFYSLPERFGLRMLIDKRFLSFARYTHSRVISVYPSDARASSSALMSHSTTNSHIAYRTERSPLETNGR